MVEGGEALGWAGTRSLAQHKFRELPATLGKWHVAQTGNLTAFISARNFYEVTGFKGVISGRPHSGDVIINIGDAAKPDIGWMMAEPRERTGEYAGLSRYISRNPEIKNPGDTLRLPPPYNGRIECPAQAIKRGASCQLILETDGLRHSLSIMPDEIEHWRMYVDGYGPNATVDSLSHGGRPAKGTALERLL